MQMLWAKCEQRVRKAGKISKIAELKPTGHAPLKPSFLISHKSNKMRPFAQRLRLQIMATLIKAA